MVTLRFARAGTKKKPVFHVVAADSRCRRDGSFLEKLGYYVPTKDHLVIDRDRVDFWLKQGAQASESVGNLLRQKKAPVVAAAS